MLKRTTSISLAAALAMLPAAALGLQGTSSSYGSVGRGPVIPTQSLTPMDRAWNAQHQAQYQAEDSAEWLREHVKGRSPFVR